MGSLAVVVSADLLLGWAAGLAAGVCIVVLFCWPLRKQVQALEACASHDPLTQLASGTYFRSDCAELARAEPSLVVLYMYIHRPGEQDVPTRRLSELRDAARLVNAALPRCADRLYRMWTPSAQFGAVLSSCKEVIGARLALSILERLRPEGLTATIAVASTERLGWCDLALAAELACQQQIAKGQTGSWCLATEAPPKIPRTVPLVEEYPDALSAPIAVLQ